MLKSLCIAFAMFSKIPMPQFEWQEKDMKYMIACFPLVGIVIGAAVYGWSLVCLELSVNRTCFVLIGIAMPILLSGGIHVDGYMDTMDAFHSYQSREKKLEIMKDAHLGAFSVIMLFVYYLLYAGAFFQVEGEEALLLLCFGFWLSRIESAFCVIYLPCAKEDGLGRQFQSSADQRRAAFLLFIQLFICGAVMLDLSVWGGGSVLAVSILILLWYRRKCMRELGGVTGDTAGCFTCLCEAGIMLITAAGCVLQWI